jgi:hypothetical protein
MKKIFTEVKEKYSPEVDGLKINKFGLRDYFNKIAVEFSSKPIDDDVKEEFNSAGMVQDECFEDVWYEQDMNETGFVTWHQVKGFIKRIKVHDKELADERDRIQKIK